MTIECILDFDLIYSSNNEFKNKLFKIIQGK